MNTKGFTLVELLAVIVVLALIVSISFYSINRVRQNSLTDILETKISQIEQAAILYAQDHPEILTDSCDVDGKHFDNYCKVVLVGDILDAGSYFNSDTLTTEGNKVDLINDLTGNSMRQDTVQIYRNNNRIYAKMLDINSNS